MSVNPSQFQDLLAAVERALANFESRPAEPGFDQDVYDELRRIRETMLRGHRDLSDPKLKHDSRSPSGSS